MGMSCRISAAILYLLLSGGLQAIELAESNLDSPSSALLLREILSDVHSIRQQTLTVDVSGIVISSRLAMGKRVQQGEQLLQMDSREAVSRQRQAQADVVRISAQLDYQQAQLERARSNFSRGVIAEVEMEQLQSQVTQFNAELKHARAQLSIAELVVNKHQLTAPFNGVLVQATPNAGERIEPGSVVAVLLDDQHLIAKLELAPDEAIALKKGSLLLKPLANPAQTLLLKELSPAANDIGGMVKLEVYLPLGTEVIPGQSLYVGLYSNGKHDDRPLDDVVSR